MWDEKKYNIFVKADNITCHRYYEMCIRDSQSISGWSRKLYQGKMPLL